MADRISFSTVQLASSLNPATAPNPFGTAHVGGTTALNKRVLAAIAGNGDRVLEADEDGHVLAAARSAGGGMKGSATLNGIEDPVRISGHGWQNGQTVGALDLDRALVFTADRGFSLGTPGSRPGDSLTWALNDKAGVAQHLDAVSFVVDTGTSTAPVAVFLDLDGNAVASGTYRGSQAAPVDAPLFFQARHGDAVAIDFAAMTLTVNGLARSGADVDLFFARYQASPQNAITVGGLRGFSVRDLVLDRSDRGAPVNTAPHLVVTPTMAELFENAPTSAPIKIADIEIVDDGLGTNNLTLTGADAHLFQIVGKELFLKAGAALDFETNPRLDVRVEVDDPALGAGPDSSGGLSVTVRDAVEGDGRISFALAQLGTTPAAAPDPITAANLGAGTALRNKALVAIAGNGDGQLEVGEKGHVLGGAANAAGRVNQTNLNGAEDPVRITAHGWVQANTAGALDLNRTLIFHQTNGFGIQGAGGRAGDSLTWTLGDRAGVAQELDRVSFVVNTAQPGKAVEVAFDFDGDTVVGGTYRNTVAATKDVALSLNLAGGDAVVIDFQAKTLAVNGIARSGPAIDAFFDAHAASAGDSITIGGVGRTGFNVQDLVLERSDADAPANQPPTAVALANVLSALPEDTAARTKVADVIVTDDGLGANDLRLTGPHADLFEIVGTEIFLKPGAALDYETLRELSLTVEVDDPAIGAPGSVEASAGLTIAVTDVVENLPPSVSLTPVLLSLLENADTRLRVKVADIAVTDDGIGSNQLRLAGDHAGLFEIDGREVYLKAGTALDFETIREMSLTVEVDDPTLGAPGMAEGSATRTIAIGDVDETWGTITLDGSLGEWDASTRLAGGGGYALHGTFQDGAFVIGLSGSGGSIGPGTTLWLNTDLDRATGHQVFDWAAGAEYHIQFGPDGRPALYRGSDGQTFVADLDHVFNADRTGVEIALPASLVGGARQAELFADVNNAVFIPGDYTTGLLFGENKPPSVDLSPVQFALPENADTRLPIKVATITVTDDGIGANQLRLAGDHADLFEIVGREVYLKAGTALDFETIRELSLTVEVDDPTIGAPGMAEGSAAHAIGIGDVDESWGSVTLDGSTAEWTPASVLSSQSAGGVDYAVRGTYQEGAFVIAIQADGGTVDANTTVWLNTDGNKATGFQVFGGTAGAEYNINFGPDGRPALYTGGAGQTFVAHLDFVFNPAHSTVEIALPSLLVGGAKRAEVFVDVNNSVFLPGDYSNGLTFGEKPPLLPVDPTERIAIVYSETTASNYFDKTAYGQLFMAAQHQAMQAGIPFDILSEADLTDIANLAGYDAIVFPGFSHVRSSLLQGIADTLASASQDYGIGMIAMGNFLTNTETGAAIAGDSYARMKSILGVTLDGFGATGGVTLRAGTGGHPVSDDYTANELVGSYANTSYQTFRDVSGSGQTLFTQTVNGADLSAVIATTTGGRNVHFATDAVFGNNNILHEAMKWAAQGDAPEVSLQMTRGSSLFLSRNDMDQSQEIYDVVTQNPGIYDKLIPIVEQWYQDFGFVGSYYVNIGANPAEFQDTDWSVSRPYYQRLLALGNEIGTHSFTHPHDTNLLLPDVITEAIRVQKIVANPDLQPLVSGLTLAQINQQLAAALAATDPAGASPVPRSSLSPVQQALLEYSFRFQFDYSRQIIERELGLTGLGGAVPGAPEKMDASLGMMEYLGYLTGGYSGVGAGYPGAFGFLDPANTDKVYFAPNVSFDFSLIEFQNLTPAQAEAKWAAEFEQITGKGSTPIIHFPWHDYGPTEWATGGVNSGYTLQMFTNFIARAHASGTEFVTGADLARRIQTFAATDLEIADTAAGVRATVTGSNLGTFALELGEGRTIAHAGSWYAFSDTKVFVDRDGGTFDIAEGPAVADVTHIDALPMRADLISVMGDGTDLAFSFFGSGTVGIDLRTWGGNSVVAAGADGGALAGDRLTLAFDATGNHSASVDFRAGAAVAGTAGNDVIIGSDQGRRLDGAGGNDTLFGAAGADTFVFGPGAGSDVVLDFALAADRIELVGTAFATAAQALAGFAQAAGGVELALSATQKLFLADILLADLEESHLVLGGSFV